MNSLWKLGGLGLLVAVFAVGCGGDDSSSSSAKLASCKQVCDKSATASCPISLPADACKQICDAYAQTSAACQDAVKALSDCQLKEADICTTTGCDAEETAYNQACSSSK